MLVLTYTLVYVMDRAGNEDKPRFACVKRLYPAALGKARNEIKNLLTSGFTRVNCELTTCLWVQVVPLFCKSFEHAPQLIS